MVAPGGYTAGAAIINPSQTFHRMSPAPYPPPQYPGHPMNPHYPIDSPIGQRMSMTSYDMSFVGAPGGVGPCGPVEATRRATDTVHSYALPPGESFKMISEQFN